MKRASAIFALFLVIGGCQLRAQNSGYEAQVADLNGTWHKNYYNLAETEINKIRDRLNRDPKRRTEFGWGVGAFIPNTSWAFDIGDGRNLYYTHIGLCQVLSVKKVGRTKLEARVIKSQAYEDLRAEGADDKRIEQFVALLGIEFKNADSMVITDPRKGLFLGGGPVEFYRLSGPKMPFIEK